MVTMTTDDQLLPPSFQAVNKMPVPPAAESAPHTVSTIPAQATPSSSQSFTAIAGSSTQRPRANTGADVSSQSSTNSRRQSRAESTANTTANSRRSARGSSPGDDDPNDDSPGKRKKKKGQKFFCKGYGDCNLSFTRSEHLARHIRKHTGERPFNCHCGRAFSRLDNLRQHSSTVHADEPIPEGSLAATGTRYQRHIRSGGRARDVGGRARAQSNPNPGTSGQAQPQAPPPPPQHDSGLLSRRDATRPITRPGPIILPQNSGDSTPPFGNYRSNTPPESPASAVGFSREEYSWCLPNPRPLLATSTVNTPTSATFTEHRSPVASPAYHSSYNSHNSSTLNSPVQSFQSVSGIFPARNASQRRLSVPGASGSRHPYQPNRVASTWGAMPLPSPSTGWAPAPSSHASSRRESIDTSIDDVEMQNRRKTWHSDISRSSLERDLISPTTATFANTSLSGGPSEYISSPTNPQAITLPSIDTIFGAAPPTGPTSLFDAPARRIPGRTGIRRTSIARPMTLHEGITGRPQPSFVRGHNRSSSDTSMLSFGSQWENLTIDSPSGSNARGDRNGMNSPLGRTWDATLSRKRSFERSSVYIDNEPNPRNGRKRQTSIGSGDSSGSEGVTTPSTSPAEELNPGIVGEGSAEIDDHNLRTQKAMLAARDPVTGARPREPYHETSNRRHSMELGTLLNGPPGVVPRSPGAIPGQAFKALLDAATAAERLEDFGSRGYTQDPPRTFR